METAWRLARRSAGRLARDLPMRDGNSRPRVSDLRVARGPRSSYEGWKLSDQSRSFQMHLRPRSSYEGWKLGYERDTCRFKTSPRSSYEGWKLRDFERAEPPVKGARDLPMRDGNILAAPTRPLHSRARDLPMRDGNSNASADHRHHRACPRSSYEGWKRVCPRVAEPGDLCPRSSYEGWKPCTATTRSTSVRSPRSSYEGWKQHGGVRYDEFDE